MAWRKVMLIRPLSASPVLRFGILLVSSPKHDWLVSDAIAGSVVHQRKVEFVACGILAHGVGTRRYHAECPWAHMAHSTLRRDLANLTGP
ncbi:hypothetical protein KC322_g95 [Hortaea werneckii]|nr:hypothetical protein KC322_g95 [Hortaea werneckii]